MIGQLQELELEASSAETEGATGMPNPWLTATIEAEEGKETKAKSVKIPKKKNLFKRKWILKKDKEQGKAVLETRQKQGDKRVHDIDV